MRKNKDIKMFLQNSKSSISIVDNRLKVRYASNCAPNYNEHTMLQALEEPKEISSNILLKSKAINGGHVLWTENISEIGSLIDKEMKTMKSLAEDNVMLEAELKMKLREAKVDAGQYLYKKMVVEIKTILESIRDNIKEGGEDLEQKKELLCRICCQCVFIKRKMNLMFMIEEHEQLEVEDLYHSIRESAQYLSLMGGKSSISAQFFVTDKNNRDTFRYDGDCIVEAYEKFDTFSTENMGKEMIYVMKIYDDMFALWCGEVCVYEVYKSGEILDNHTVGKRKH